MCFSTCDEIIGLVILTIINALYWLIFFHQPFSDRASFTFRELELLSINSIINLI